MSRLISLEQLKQYWQTAAIKIDSMPFRDRAILLLVLLGLTYGGWWLMLRKPLATEKTNLAEEIKLTQDRVNRLQVQKNQMSNDILQSPVAEEKQKVEKLEQQVQERGHKIREFEDKVVPYEQLTKLLGKFLVKDKELHLNSLQSSEARTLFESDQQKLYRRSVQVNFQSESYFAVLQYLQRLEASHWKFDWDRLSYDVSNYPGASVSIRLYTLGYKYSPGGSDAEQ